MATVFYFLPKNAPLTEEEKAELAALKNRPIVYDEDCMPLSEESERKNDYIMRKYNTRRVTKELWLKEFPEDFQKRKAEAAG